MAIRHLSHDNWQGELDSFSRQHEGWIVSIETRTREGGVAVEAHDVPLAGVSVTSPSAAGVAIAVGGESGHLTHQVPDVVSVALELTDSRAERALIIHSGDGTITSLRFRSAMRPEEVDGLPFMDRQ